ncbi:S-4TM family putative pore-forming effector [Nonomuraea cavernae]|uniref:Uncharacterized protein n=1 Tax=Nonomuraea cavernae TaxID=2045107 RepID=A0A918DK78_9ACTN|nr:S-4TM family putative pore-forming effector [Nonomuraea cavernae]MCA2186293.1 hypothetical protein [Nonomuraea cavernae]GGO69624.1 hypothetical protein GCM10012289_31160 [Nonomuraea cavernae]
MPAPPGTVQERQNRPHMHDLLRAARLCHLRAQRIDGLRLSVSALLGLLGLIGAVAPATATPIAVGGALWAIAYAAGLGTAGRGALRRAALLQEMFDVEVFELPWNDVAAGKRIPIHEVHALAQRSKLSDEAVRDYYVTVGLPRPFDVLGCQAQNLSWAARIRRRFARVLLTAVGVWSVTGLAVGWAVGLTVGELLLRWYVPSIGALLMALDTYRAQRDTATERDRVADLLDDRTNSPGQAADLLVLARQVQDVVLHARQTHVRVPEVFSRWSQAKDRADYEAAQQDLAARVRNGGRPRP